MITQDELLGVRNGGHEMTKQFEQVNCRYGAPMGRREDGYLEVCMPRSVRLFQVRLDSGGYDDGGAYWGHSTPLWCEIDDDGNQKFIRAATRERAALELHIPNRALKKPLPDPVNYGLAVLDGRAPMPDGHCRASVVEWIRESGYPVGI